MKRNAIIRIVIWSVVLAILLGLLLLGFSANFAYRSYRRNVCHEGVATIVPQRIEEDSTAPADAQFQSTTTKVEINWLSGSIRIQPREDIQTILVKETGDYDTRYAMVCHQNGSKLTVDYCEDSLRTVFGVNIPKKDLTIWVPQGMSLQELEVDAASAKVYVTGLTIGEVDINTASGQSEFTDCTVGTLDVDTASGDVFFSGTLDKLSCEAASASIRAELQNVPSSLDIDTMSGDLELTLPEDAGFTVNLDAMSHSFRSDFPTNGNGGTYVCGDGRCFIQMDTMSGKVNIRKAQS